MNNCKVLALTNQKRGWYISMFQKEKFFYRFNIKLQHGTNVHGHFTEQEPKSTVVTSVRYGNSPHWH